MGSNHYHHCHRLDLKGMDRSASRRLQFATALMVAFVAFEIAAGMYSHSLSVLGDAAQNFVDALALGLAFWGQKLLSRPPDRLRTFGYQRATILIAFVNSAIMVPVIIEIASRAVARFFHPAGVDGTVLGLVGFVGLFCNLAVVLALRSSSKQLHVKGAYLHNLADALGSIALLLSGIVIAYTGLYWVDLVAAGFICVLLVASVVPVVRRCVHILLEGSPDGVDPEQIVARLSAVPGVVEVHDLHAWLHGDNMPALTCHVRVSPRIRLEAQDETILRIRQLLKDEFGLTHTTIQLEHGNCEQSDRCLWQSETECATAETPH